MCVERPWEANRNYVIVATDIESLSLSAKTIIHICMYVCIITGHRPHLPSPRFIVHVSTVASRRVICRTISFNFNTHFNWNFNTNLDPKLYTYLGISFPFPFFTIHASILVIVRKAKGMVRAEMLEIIEKQNSNGTANSRRMEGGKEEKEVENIFLLFSMYNMFTLDVRRNGKSFLSLYNSRDNWLYPIEWFVF